MPPGPRSAFPHLPPCVRRRDELGALYKAADFAASFPTRARYALPRWRLALVTVVRFLDTRSTRTVEPSIAAA